MLQVVSHRVKFGVASAHRKFRVKQSFTNVPCPVPLLSETQFGQHISPAASLTLCIASWSMKTDTTPHFGIPSRRGFCLETRACAVHCLGAAGDVSSRCACEPAGGGAVRAAETSGVGLVFQRLHVPRHCHRRAGAAPAPQPVYAQLTAVEQT